MVVIGTFIFAAHGIDVALAQADGEAGKVTRCEDTVYYTHYDYLELPPGASTARIEAAYHSIRQRMNGHSDPRLVELVQQAYMVLSNPAVRLEYDRELQCAADEADWELKTLLDQESARLPRRVQDVPAPLLAVIKAWAA